jgi:hypothetical protein
MWAKTLRRFISYDNPNLWLNVGNNSNAFTCSANEPFSNIGHCSGDSQKSWTLRLVPEQSAIKNFENVTLTFEHFSTPIACEVILQAA